MFPGRSNNEMLKYIMQTKGKFKTKLLKRSAFAHEYFNTQNYNTFLSYDESSVSKG
jgi:serine/threonine-protein kinase PRP4